MKGIVAELVQGGHLVSLSASSITLTSMILMGLPIAPELIIGAYLFTYATYGLNRKVEYNEDLISHAARANYLHKNARLRFYLIPSFYAASLLVSALHNLYFPLVLLVPMALGYGYTVGSRGISLLLGSHRFKEIFIGKNLTISIGWGMVPPLLLFAYERSFNITAAVLASFFFLRTFVNSVFCDMRDTAGDIQAGIKTLPSVLGLNKTRDCLLLITVLTGIFLATSVFIGLLATPAYFLMVAIAYGSFYLVVSLRRKADMNILCDVFADGEDLMYTPLVWLGSTVFYGVV